MEFEIFTKMAFQVIGGLGIFLLGMNHMSNGLQTIAGPRLRTLIGAVTNNRLLSVGVGTFVTTIVQSSSITTVMVVGFVNSGLMTLNQALGVILGANIGTTITGWILVLKIGKYGLPILGVAAFFYLFSKNERIKFLAMGIMGVGMVFFGLTLMKNGFKPIRSFPEFEAWFHAFSAASYWGVLKCALVGCVLTFLVQSSSATLAITIGLASAGVINFTTAAALVLGENIGTTITAYLASLNASPNAKRAAYGHVIFNIIGVLWITAIFQWYMELIQNVLGADPNMMVMENGTENYPYIKQAIAMVHTGFNVVNTLIFIPFLGIFATFLQNVVKDRGYKETPQLTCLDARMLDTPLMIIEQSKHELGFMAEKTQKMLNQMREVISSTGDEDDNNDREKSIFYLEEVLDKVQEEISTFLVHVLSGNIPHQTVEEARAQLRMADEYESVSDYVTAILKLYLKLKENDEKLTKEKREDLLLLHDMIDVYFKQVNDAIETGNPHILTSATSEGNNITHTFRNLRGQHLERLGKSKVSPLLSVSYMNMLNSYRRIRDHILNIAEASAGNK